MARRSYQVRTIDANAGILARMAQLADPAVQSLAALANDPLDPSHRQRLRPGTAVQHITHGQGRILAEWGSLEVH